MSCITVPYSKNRHICIKLRSTGHDAAKELPAGHTPVRRRQIRIKLTRSNTRGDGEAGG